MFGHGVQRSPERRFLYLEIPDTGGDAHGFVQPLHGADQRGGSFFHIGVGQADNPGQFTVADSCIETVEPDGIRQKHGVGQAVGNMEAVSVLAAGSFGSAAMGETVTRADAAQIRMGQPRRTERGGTLLEGEPAGLFDWLL